MLAAEHRRRNKRPMERRAKTTRRSFAFTKPKASARKLHHPDVVKSKSKTPEQKRSRVLELPISNGASPVASALGIRLGATPCGLHQPNRASPARLSKQDISTLLGIGHFYFALTGVKLVKLGGLGWGMKRIPRPTDRLPLRPPNRLRQKRPRPQPALRPRPSCRSRILAQNVYFIATCN
jgi:hypothetical protein